VSTVPEGGQITYTITVKNDGNGSGDCTDITVTDVIPDLTDCVTSSVDSSSDISSSHWDITHNCPRSSGTVTWSTTSNLSTGDQAVLTMVVDVTSDAGNGDTIDNQACATSTDDEVGDCDTATTDVTSATATATAGPTATMAPITPIPTVRPYVPPVVVPTAVVVPLIIPNTGSGPGSSGGTPLALALGLAGGALLLLSGTGLWMRRRT
jgi:uncharacterized repeat protein (TIGR01451 family)